MPDDCTRPSGVLGLVRTAKAVAFGTSPRSNSSLFGARSAAMIVIPVILPPGARKAPGQAQSDGIAADHEDNGNGGCRSFGRDRRRRAPRRHGHRPADQVSRQFRQPIQPAIREPVVDIFPIGLPAPIAHGLSLSSINSISLDADGYAPPSKQGDVIYVIVILDVSSALKLTDEQGSLVGR